MLYIDNPIRFMSRQMSYRLLVDPTGALLTAL
jgi:hypothetical protein